MTAEPPGEEDPLGALRDHVRAARESAERLGREAVDRDAPEPQTPPMGWEPSQEDRRQPTAEGGRALVDLLDSLRDLIPEDLSEQLLALLRQLLAVVRALLDLLISRLAVAGAQGGQGRDVQDIPIV